MTLRFLDSFDHYTTNAQMDLKWNGGASGPIAPSAGNGRNSTAALSNSNPFGENALKTLDNQATWTVGFAMRTTNSFTNNENYLDLKDSGSSQCGIFITNTGAIAVRRGGAGGTTLATSTNVMSINTWYYVEFKCTIHNTTGAYEVRVDGTSVGWVPAATGANTRNTANNYANQIQLGIQRLDWTRYDDFYVCDSNGSTNNTFLGDVRVEALYPSGAGNLSQFTPSAGNNYQCVDETTPNDDTDYVATSGVGNRDLYAFTNLATVSGTVLGIQTNMYARKDDAGTRTISPILRYNSATYSGYTGSSISTTYSYYMNIIETNPATASRWIITEVNDTEFGINLDA